MALTAPSVRKQNDHCSSSLAVAISRSTANSSSFFRSDASKVNAPPKERDKAEYSYWFSSLQERPRPRGKLFRRAYDLSGDAVERLAVDRGHLEIGRRGVRQKVLVGHRRVECGAQRLHAILRRVRRDRERAAELGAGHHQLDDPPFVGVAR